MMFYCVNIVEDEHEWELGLMCQVISTEASGNLSLFRLNHRMASKVRHCSHSTSTSLNKATHHYCLQKRTLIAGLLKDDAGGITEILWRITE